MERWVNVREAAIRLGYTGRHVRRLIDEGKINARRRGILGWLKVEVGELERFMSSFVPRETKPDIEKSGHSERKPDASGQRAS